MKADYAPQFRRRFWQKPMAVTNPPDDAGPFPASAFERKVDGWFDAFFATVGAVCMILATAIILRQVWEATQ